MLMASRLGEIRRMNCRELAIDLFVKGGYSLDQFECVIAQVIEMGIEEDLVGIPYSREWLDKRLARELEKCACAKCTDYVHKDDYGYPECLKCFYDLDGVCA